MDPRDVELTRLLAARERRRRKLAALPFPDKLRDASEHPQGGYPASRLRKPASW